MIASTIFFNDDSAVWTVLSVGSHIVGSARIIPTLLQPLFDGLALGWSVKFHATGKTKLRLAGITGHPKGFRWLQGIDHSIAMGIGALTKSWMDLMQ